MMKTAKKMTCMAICLNLVALTAQGALLNVDFSTATFEDQATGYLGGWFGNEMSFGQWYGEGIRINMGGHGLTVNNSATDSFRGTVIFLEPSLFGGEAGTYTLQFEVTELSFFDAPNNPENTPIDGTPGTHGSGWVGIMEANGYDLDQNPPSGDAIFVNTTPGNSANLFEAEGSATVENLASMALLETGVFSLDFTYGGTGAVGLAFGSINSAYPHTLINYDNVVVIPELSSFLLGILALGSVCLGNKIRNR